MHPTVTTSSTISIVVTPRAVAFVAHVIVPVAATLVETDVAA
jgi:hypothetical protein